MCTGVVIERAHESERRLFVSKVTSTVRTTIVISSKGSIINRVVNYFVQLKKHNGGHGPLKRRLEATSK